MIIKYKDIKKYMYINNLEDLRKRCCITYVFLRSSQTHIARANPSFSVQ